MPNCPCSPSLDPFRSGLRCVSNPSSKVDLAHRTAHLEDSSGAVRETWTAERRGRVTRAMIAYVIIIQCGSQAVLLPQTHGVCERKGGQERDAHCDDVGASWQHFIERR